MIVASACRSATGADEEDPAACPQTYEFGNYGCARLVAIVEGPPTPWPASFLFDVRAIPIGEFSGLGVALAPAPGLGAVPLQLTLWQPPPQFSGDTLSMWVRAWMLEQAATGGRLTVFAADSVLRVVRWAPVGEVPPVDTVRLVLRRP